MKRRDSPLPLKNAPLHFAPENELGVVFLFAHVARRLGFRVDTIGPRFPDCIAFRRVGDVERQVRIEFEYRSSSFRAHGHDAGACDAIVCWHHDWPDVPEHLEVIELKEHFGVARKVWIQQAIRSQFELLDGSDRLCWQLSKQATPGDVLLMYRCSPVSALTDVCVFSGSEVSRGDALWREGECYAGEIRRICRLASPIFLRDLRQHPVLKTASFVRRNMQGQSLQATEYWAYLHEMILKRNLALHRLLAELRPDKL